MPTQDLDGPLVVLLVEDDQGTRELYRIALRKTGGFKVVAVGDGDEALRYLDVRMPDVVVLDLGLPRMNGRDVLAEIAARGLQPRIPVVVVTGEDAGGLNATHYDCVLRKPIEPEVLVAAVLRCVVPRARPL